MATDSSPENTPGSKQAMPPAVRRRLQQCYEHGTRLAREKNCDHDYINELLAQCVVRDPGNLVYVEAFLDNLQKKYNNNKKGGKGAIARGPLKKAVAKEEWEAIFELSPAALAVNPWDVQTLRALADACKANQYNEVELRYLKNALDANPSDVEVNKHCATTLARVGQFDQAIACWHRIEQIKRDDVEAARMISELTLEKQRAKIAGDDLAEEQRKQAKAAPAAGQQAKGAAAEPEKEGGNQVAEKKRREIELTPRQQVERLIVADPTVVENYVQLAALFTEEGRHGDAERTLSRALEVSGNDLKIRELLEDTQIRRSADQLALAEQRAEKFDNEQVRQLAERLKEEHNRLELEVYGGRCQRYPEDKALQHELGVRLKRSGNHAEALKCFQISRETAELKAASTYEMGDCLHQLKQYPKALQCYARAAELGLQQKLGAVAQLSLYKAGVLAMGLKEWDQAQQHFQNLEQIRPDFKDVRARLDKIKAIGNKE